MLKKIERSGDKMSMWVKQRDDLSLNWCTPDSCCCWHVCKISSQCLLIVPRYESKSPVICALTHCSSVVNSSTRPSMSAIQWLNCIPVWGSLWRSSVSVIHSGPIAPVCTYICSSRLSGLRFCVPLCKNRASGVTKLQWTWLLWHSSHDGRLAWMQCLRRRWHRSQVRLGGVGQLDGCGLGAARRNGGTVRIKVLDFSTASALK
jgi:hypothetical protein